MFQHETPTLSIMIPSDAHTPTQQPARREVHQQTEVALSAQCAREAERSCVAARAGADAREAVRSVDAQHADPEAHIVEHKQIAARVTSALACAS